LRQLCSVSYQLLHMSHTQRICKYGCSWGYQIVGNSPFTGKAFAWWVANHKTWVPFKIKLRFYGTRGHLKVEHCFIHHCPLKPDPMVTQLGNWVSSELANDYNIVMFSLNQNMKVECKQQWSLELGGTFHNCRILQEHTWWFGMPILKSHRYFLLCKLSLSLSRLLYDEHNFKQWDEGIVAHFLTYWIHCQIHCWFFCW
jgi:hypothetical protein